jgi:hypothetical protein
LIYKLAPLDLIGSYQPYHWVGVFLASGWVFQVIKSSFRSGFASKTSKSIDVLGKHGLCKHLKLPHRIHQPYNIQFNYQFVFSFLKQEMSLVSRVSLLQILVSDAIAHAYVKHELFEGKGESHSVQESELLRSLGLTFFSFVLNSSLIRFSSTDFTA